jgi:hypothetical protein
MSLRKTTIRITDDKYFYIYICKHGFGAVVCSIETLIVTQPTMSTDGFPYYFPSIRLHIIIIIIVKHSVVRGVVVVGFYYDGLARAKLYRDHRLYRTLYYTVRRTR